MSNSSPIPEPIAVIIAWISRFDSTLLIRFFSELITFPRRGRIAWKRRSRASTAEPPAELPSTRKSSAASGSLIWQSASLPGSDDRLLDDPLRLGGVFLEELTELLVHRHLDEAAHSGIAELRLRLPLELRLAQLHRDDRGESLADVLAVEVLLLLLQEAELARVA